jgi:hypothetical protein
VQADQRKLHRLPRPEPDRDVFAVVHQAFERENLTAELAVKQRQADALTNPRQRAQDRLGLLRPRAPKPRFVPRRISYRPPWFSRFHLALLPKPRRRIPLRWPTWRSATRPFNFRQKCTSPDARTSCLTVPRRSRLPLHYPSPNRSARQRSPLGATRRRNRTCPTRDRTNVPQRVTRALWSSFKDARAFPNQGSARLRAGTT